MTEASKEPVNKGCSPARHRVLKRHQGDLVEIVPWRGFARLEALTAIDRFAWSRVERHFGLLTALGACCREELARSRIVPAAIPTIATAIGRAIGTAAAVSTAIVVSTTAGVALGLAGLAAIATTLWIRESPLLIELLLTLGEHEFLPTIAAGQRSITHSV